MARLKAPPPTPAGSVPPELRDRFDPVWADPAAVTKFYKREHLDRAPERLDVTPLDRHRLAVTAWAAALDLTDQWGRPDHARMREAGITMPSSRDRLTSTYERPRRSKATKKTS